MATGGCCAAANGADARAPPNSITISDGIGMQDEEIDISPKTARSPCDATGWVRKCSIGRASLVGSFDL